MKRILSSFLFCLLFSSQWVLAAGISFPAFISDGMVLQQRSNAPLWGKSSENSEITVVTSWDNKKYITRSDEKGNWKLHVATPAAGGPYSITIVEVEKRTTLHDILIGEVWLCSGQSNMEMPMKGFKNQPVENSNMDILKSTNSNLRLFTVKEIPRLHRRRMLVANGRLRNLLQCGSSVRPATILGNCCRKCCMFL